MFFKSAYCLLFLLAGTADGAAFVPATGSSRQASSTAMKSSVTSYAPWTQTGARVANPNNYADRGAMQVNPAVVPRPGQFNQDTATAPYPHIGLNALTAVEACLDTLIDHVHYRDQRFGLEQCYHFSNEHCKAKLGGSLESFEQFIRSPIYGALAECLWYQIDHVGPLSPGDRSRGEMQTVLVDAFPSNDIEEEDGSSNATHRRRFIFTMMKERNPASPFENCWLIHDVTYVPNAYHQAI